MKDTKCKINYNHLSEGDRILLWAEVKQVHRRVPSGGENDVRIKVEFDICDPSTMDIELAKCEIVEHRAYKTIFAKLIDKVKKVVALKPLEEEALDQAKRRF